MERMAIVASFEPEQSEQVKELLAEGPPYDLAESTLDRHAVYLSPREVVFVFEGPDVEWQVDDLRDDFFRPGVRSAVADWQKLVDGKPRLAHPVFAWDREGAGDGAEPAQDGTVAGAMETSFVEVAPEDTLAEAVERMTARGLGPALVVDFGRLIGVLGPEQVLRAVSERVHPSDGRVREWMIEPPATVSPGTSLAEAAAEMIQTASHHLPVVEGERPVGVVDLRGIVSAGFRAAV